MSQSDRKKSKPENIPVSADQTGRRIDNFLISRLGRIPKSRIYQMLRRGEVRINGRRVKPDYRLQTEDKIRIPPIFEQTAEITEEPAEHLIEMMKTCVVYEDERVVVVNKPAGLVVHSGTGSAFGVIELLRRLYEQEQSLHLVHRLDKDTSGCLMIAKSMPVLRQVNQALKTGNVQKEYDALLKGRLQQKKMIVDTPLQRHRSGYGGRRVKVGSGKTALSEFEAVEFFRDTTRVKVRIDTGRTHQIRVHADSIGHPIAGDGKYGDREFNREMRKVGLKRMFLHAGKLSVLALKKTGEHQFRAPLPADLDAFLVHIIPLANQ